MYFYKSVLKVTYADSLSDMAQPCDIDSWVMKWRSAWPIFHASAILPYILKTIWCMKMIVWDNGSVWADVWPKNKSRSLGPIFHASVILPYILKTIWCMTTTVWDNGSVWLDVWLQNKSKSLWPIFYGSVILTCLEHYLMYEHDSLG